MWSIVHFVTENTVEAVPGHWEVKGKCAWPKKKALAQKLIERRTKPNEIDFNFFNVRVLCHTKGKVKHFFFFFKILLHYFYYHLRKVTD